MTKELNEKAISIKGKQYVLVSDRVIFFNENFLKGCITTELVSWTAGTIVMKAKAYPEGLEGRYFTGYSQAIVGEGYINKTAALENAETSAVGRALGFMGIGVIDGVASVDEIRKAEFPVQPPEPPKSKDKLGGKCDKCGADMVMSKAGKIYCKSRCWLPEAERNKSYTPKPKVEPEFDPTEHYDF